MSKVVRLKKPKDCKVFKIEGELFEKVRAYQKQLEKLANDCRKAHKKYEDAANKIRDIEWALIYKEFNIDPDECFKIEDDYEDLGFYIVKRVQPSIFNRVFDENEED